MIKTKSYCEICKTVIDAEYIFEGRNTYFLKRCTKHKSQKTNMNVSPEQFRKWMQAEVINIPPAKYLTSGMENQCPTNCGPCTEHKQTACCVLIDITDRCNQKCPLCFASSEEGSKEKDVPFEEVINKLKFLKSIGEETPFNIQLSGGEPTVREDLIDIISVAKEIGFTFIQINSNGKRIGLEEGYAAQLKAAGVSVIFMQFDGTKEEIYRQLRGENLLDIKKKAIENCRKAGLAVTLVPTIVGGINLDNIGEMTEFMLENIDVVKGIHFQPVSYFGRHPKEKKRVSMFQVMDELAAQTSYKGSKNIFKKTDYIPISSGHPLCCFYSVYIKDGSDISLQISTKDREEGISCCEAEQIKKDRDFVYKKWSVGEEDGIRKVEKSEDISTMDEFIKFYKENTFTITGMPFQDIETLDSDRLKRCRVQVLSKENKLIPFCAYNSIYRGEEKC